VRSVRAGDDSAKAIPTQATGTQKGEKTMARHKLTLQEQLRGVRAAIHSRRTPPQLKKGLERHRDKLEKKLARSKDRNRGFLGATGI
jgi:hypothetical protein